MPLNLYGPVVHGGTLERAARDTLRVWLPAYLAELERQTGRDPGSLPQIRSWVNVPDYDKFPDDQLPCVVLICPGTASVPARESGLHNTEWELRAATVVSADNEANTLELAKVYAAAVRAALVQHPSLGGIAQSTKWLGESYDDLPIEKRRSLASGEVAFSIHVQDVLDVNGGPAAPPGDPLEDPGDWPEVATHDVSIENEEP